MSLEMQTVAHINENNKVQITSVVNNPTDSSVDIGSMTSQLYKIKAVSQDGEHFGDSAGYLQAPHHLTVPNKKSAVFTREFETMEGFEAEMEDLSFDPDEFLDYITSLEPTTDEPVTITVKVLLKSDELDNLHTEFTITPTELEQRDTDAVIEDAAEYPRTENSIQLG